MVYQSGKYGTARPTSRYYSSSSGGSVAAAKERAKAKGARYVGKYSLPQGATAGEIIKYARKNKLTLQELANEVLLTQRQAQQVEKAINKETQVILRKKQIEQKAKPRIPTKAAAQQLLRQQLGSGRQQYSIVSDDVIESAVRSSGVSERKVETYMKKLRQAREEPYELANLAKNKTFLQRVSSPQARKNVVDVINKASAEIKKLYMKSPSEQVKVKNTAANKLANEIGRAILELPVDIPAFMLTAAVSTPFLVRSASTSVFRREFKKNIKPVIKSSTELNAKNVIALILLIEGARTLSLSEVNKIKGGSGKLPVSTRFRVLKNGIVEIFRRGKKKIGRVDISVEQKALVSLEQFVRLQKGKSVRVNSDLTLKVGKGGKVISKNTKPLVKITIPKGSAAYKTLKALQKAGSKVKSTVKKVQRPLITRKAMNKILKQKRSKAMREARQVLKADIVTERVLLAKRANLLRAKVGDVLSRPVRALIRRINNKIKQIKSKVRTPLLAKAALRKLQRARAKKVIGIEKDIFKAEVKQYTAEMKTKAKFLRNRLKADIRINSKLLAKKVIKPFEDLLRINQRLWKKLKTTVQRKLILRIKNFYLRLMLRKFQAYKTESKIRFGRFEVQIRKKIASRITKSQIVKNRAWRDKQLKIDKIIEEVNRETKMFKKLPQVIVKRKGKFVGTSKIAKRMKAFRKTIVREQPLQKAVREIKKLDAEIMNVRRMRSKSISSDNQARTLILTKRLRNLVARKEDRISFIQGTYRRRGLPPPKGLKLSKTDLAIKRITSEPAIKVIKGDKAFMKKYRAVSTKVKRIKNKQSKIKKDVKKAKSEGGQKGRQVLIQKEKEVIDLDKELAEASKKLRGEKGKAKSKYEQETKKPTVKTKTARKQQTKVRQNLKLKFVAATSGILLLADLSRENSKIKAAIRSALKLPTVQRPKSMTKSMTTPKVDDVVVSVPVVAVAAVPAAIAVALPKTLYQNKYITIDKFGKSLIMTTKDSGERIMRKSRGFIFKKGKSFVYAPDLASLFYGRKAKAKEAIKLLRVGRYFTGFESRKII